MFCPEVTRGQVQVELVSPDPHTDLHTRCIWSHSAITSVRMCFPSVTLLLSVILSHCCKLQHAELSCYCQSDTVRTNLDTAANTAGDVVHGTVIWFFLCLLVTAKDVHS